MLACFGGVTGRQTFGLLASVAVGITAIGGGKLAGRFMAAQTGFSRLFYFEEKVQLKHSYG